MPAANGLNIPFDRQFYETLIDARDSFRRVSTHTVPRGQGYAFRVEAGYTFRLTELEAAQIMDTCVFNADEPSEHYHASTQVALEGMQITRLTRVWSAPPNSRPLCTCIADSVRPRADVGHAREHTAVGAHCNPHLWMLYTGRHPRTCYDNLRAGLARVGLSQKFIHDNMNLFQNTAIDVTTGDYLLPPGNSESGDYVEFYAEVPLLVAISICPHGAGSVPIEDWREGEVKVYPIGVEIFETGITPRGWPY